MNFLETILIVAVLFVTTASVLAGDHCCPDCGCKTCSPSIVPVTTKHHCYEVECKDICIPKFSWPWEKCCTPKCGRVKTVKVLKKVDYKCESCGCKWEVTCVECCQQGGYSEPKSVELPADQGDAPLPPAASTRAVPRDPHYGIPGPQVSGTQASARRSPRSTEKKSFFDLFVKSPK